MLIKKAETSLIIRNYLIEEDEERERGKEIERERERDNNSHSQISIAEPCQNVLLYIDYSHVIKNKDVDS